MDDSPSPTSPATTNTTATTTSSTANSQTNRSKRRIPPHQRQRAPLSCDRCKKRRVKCIRPLSADEHDPCQTCRAHNVRCESTLPRKQRIYGSVETLSLRYRALDALVAGLFPHEQTGHVQTLYDIAKARGITMPAADADAQQQHHQHEISMSPSEDGRAGAAFRQLPSPAYTSPHMSSREAQQPHAVTPNRTEQENPWGVPKSTNVAEEKLVPAPRGTSHYIGPSSSFGFVISVRKLVSEFTKLSVSQRPRGGPSTAQSEFIDSRTSKALESRSPGHEGEEEEEERQAQLGVDDSVEQMRRSQGTRVSTAWHPPAVTQKHSLLHILPPRNVADALVEAFFDHVHHNFLLFHRGTFQMRYESMWGACDEDDGTAEPRDLEHGWLCCIWMVFVFGAQKLEHHDPQQAGAIQRRFLGLVQARLHSLLGTTALQNVQALVMLTVSYHAARERNTGWIVLGCAVRMAMALGMHREKSRNFNPIEREVRRRVWWTMYVFEEHLCMVLGRPSLIRDEEIKVLLPNMNLLDCNDGAPPEYLDYVIRLTRLSTRVRQTIYSLPLAVSHHDGSVDVQMARQLLTDLEAWRASLPPYLSMDWTSSLPKQHRSLLLLHITYKHLQTLVTRPFLLAAANLRLQRQLRPHEAAHDQNGEEASLSNVCAIAARQTAEYLGQLATHGMLDGVAGLDVYFIYHSVLILSVAFLGRAPDEIDSAEDVERRAAARAVIEAARTTKLCPTWAVLSQVAIQLAKIVGISPEDATDGPAPQPDPVVVAQGPEASTSMAAFTRPPDPSQLQRTQHFTQTPPPHHQQQHQQHPHQQQNHHTQNLKAAIPFSPIPTASAPPPPQLQAWPNPSTNVQGVINDWFQQNPVGIPAEFFDAANDYSEAWALGNDFLYPVAGAGEAFEHQAQAQAQVQQQQQQQQQHSHNPSSGGLANGGGCSNSSSSNGNSNGPSAQGGGPDGSAGGAVGGRNGEGGPVPRQNQHDGSVVPPLVRPEQLVLPHQQQQQQQHRHQQAVFGSHGR